LRNLGRLQFADEATAFSMRVFSGIMIMRGALLGSVIFVLATSSNLANAGPPLAEPASQDKPVSAKQGYETYRGYVFDLSENSNRKDMGAIADMLRRQLDVVESVGFSPRVLQFFHTVPILASEMACLDEGAGAACYGLAVPSRHGRPSHALTTWDPAKAQWTNPDIIDLAADSGVGVVMLRPAMMQYAQDPVMLHEFLHVYHAKLMPHGYDNKGVIGFYAEAQSKAIYPKESYTLRNNREFFAVTASIFLVGKDSVHEPFTRDKLKEKQPNYYKYLVGVFGFDPDASTNTPVASATAGGSS
jgi:hypothetical protein